jgi:hypothetical protein
MEKILTQGDIDRLFRAAQGAAVPKDLGRDADRPFEGQRRVAGWPAW